ncbi:glycoside hydrolase family 25 protein [Acinetobacter towneri]|uniref:glycoside hydrolase family 25 protein n=1 Tax=Acinetobacter towneri TaxID=202956 RepID=UPI002096F7B9|nr:glycoside hydrolase family 25 protein [Acinetobacter towneri]MCO8048796.1 glycoside hydrolase family 25 protein [Acinetobacter towneri]
MRKPSRPHASSKFTPHYRIAIGVIGSAILAVFIYFGILRQSPAAAQDYPIQGFDVSHHQGEIQWHKISPQKYAFVYLKATEGGDFKDRKFQHNWLKARERGFLVGAYHFYRLCRDGKTQAENFMNTVPKKQDSLPPVIDLEYDSNCINTYTKEQLLKEIQSMHDALYQHYEKQPIFYVSKAFYNMVLTESFAHTPLWVREYHGKPQLAGQPKWLFWQHTNQGKITGIATRVDLNVFYGNAKQWQQFLDSYAIQPLNLEAMPKK